MHADDTGTNLPPGFLCNLHVSRYVGFEDPTIGQSSAEYHSESFLSDLSRLRTHIYVGFEDPIIGQSLAKYLRDGSLIHQSSDTLSDQPTQDFFFSL